jgi:glutaredoxin
VTLYTRRGCHLCDRAHEKLIAHQQRFGFTLEVADVDSHADLAEQFGTTVPVVAVNGRVRFRGTVNDALLRRVLEALDPSQEAGGSSGAS